MRASPAAGSMKARGGPSTSPSQADRSSAGIVATGAAAGLRWRRGTARTMSMSSPPGTRRAAKVLLSLEGMTAYFTDAGDTFELRAHRLVSKFGEFSQ